MSASPLLLAVATALSPMASPAAQAAQASPTAPATRAAAATPAQEVREVRLSVAGRSIRVLCVGGPTRVILLHGDRSSADGWRSVLERLPSGSVGACAYDRAGSGESRPAPDPRGWFELLDEMRGIHEALSGGAPYVLVGHSLGGLYARLYAADRPRDVAGLLLVDPAHEEMPEETRAGMPAAAWDAWQLRRGEPNADGLREAALAPHAAHSALPSVPVTVLTARIRQEGEGWDSRRLEEAARRLHAKILRGVPGGRHVPAERSGHDVQLDQPELVVRELMRLVGAAGLGR